MPDTAVEPQAPTPLPAGLGGLGRHEGPHRGWWTPLRLTLLALGVVLAAGYLQKLPCRDTARWTEQYQFTHICYTDVVASWTAYHLDAGSVPFLSGGAPYPPLIGAFMQVASMLAHVGTPSAGAYFDVTAVLLAVCAVVMVVTTAALASRRRPWDALMVAVAPVLLMQAYTNWDLLPVALLGIAMVLWSKGTPVGAGAVLGLAVAAKLWPILLLLALVLLCWRAGMLRLWLRAAVACVVVWALVSIPVALLATSEWSLFWRDNIGRGADWDSLWLPLGDALQRPFSPFELNAVVLVVAGIIAVAVSVLVLRAPRRPRVPQVLFVLLALFLVVGKVFSPQDALWLTPLAVLARPRWGLFLVWQATEVVLTVNRMLLLLSGGTPDRALPRGWWYVTVSVRDLALLALVAFVVREMVNPNRDVVREGGVDDPAGGPLDGAPDTRVDRDSTAGVLA